MSEIKGYSCFTDIQNVSNDSSRNTILMVLSDFRFVSSYGNFKERNFCRKTVRIINSVDVFRIFSKHSENICCSAFTCSSVTKVHLLHEVNWRAGANFSGPTSDMT
jgi:hypothetical protein